MNSANHSPSSPDSIVERPLSGAERTAVVGGVCTAVRNHIEQSKIALSNVQPDILLKLLHFQCEHRDLHPPREDVIMVIEDVIAGLKIRVAADWNNLLNTLENPSAAQKRKKQRRKKKPKRGYSMEEAERLLAEQEQGHFTALNPDALDEEKVADPEPVEEEPEPNVDLDAVLKRAIVLCEEKIEEDNWIRLSNISSRRRIALKESKSVYTDEDADSIREELIRYFLERGIAVRGFKNKFVLHNDVVLEVLMDTTEAQVAQIYQQHIAEGEEEEATIEDSVLLDEDPLTGVNTSAFTKAEQFIEHCFFDPRKPITSDVDADMRIEIYSARVQIGLQRQHPRDARHDEYLAASSKAEYIQHDVKAANRMRKEISELSKGKALYPGME